MYVECRRILPDTTYYPCNLYVRTVLYVHMMLNTHQRYIHTGRLDYCFMIDLFGELNTTTRVPWYLVVEYRYLLNKEVKSMESHIMKCMTNGIYILYLTMK